MKKIVNGCVEKILEKKILLCISFYSKIIYFLKTSDQILKKLLRYVRNLLCAQKNSFEH